MLSAIAIAIFLRLINLDSREFWYDEVLSLLLSSSQKSAYQTPPDIPIALAKYTSLLSLPIENGIGDFATTIEKLLKGLVGEPHPPLFFIQQHFWLRLFGNSEVAMRSSIALFSIAAMGSIYSLGRRLLGDRGGLALAALLGLNPYYLFHSLNVRMYGSLVFWTILSTQSLLELVDFNRNRKRLNNIYKNQNKTKLFTSKWFWIPTFIVSVTAGLMTFYYFACWLVVLLMLAIALDRRRWWQYGLCLVSSVLITTPWLWWGTRQQLNNADLGRFAASSNPVEAIAQHLLAAIQVLGTHLLLGDWVSSLPPIVSTLAGIGAIAILVACCLSLWHRRQRRLLGIGLLLGILPLFLMLAIDGVTGNMTVGFGWGRSVIFILPGCLFLLASAIAKGTQKWQKPLIIMVLLLYLSIDISDFTLRSRRMFHQIADIAAQQPTATTLIAIDSPAWGHILRLAYYLPPSLPIELLAQKSDRLAPTLAKVLASAGDRYQRLIWLESAKPVWGKPSTPAQTKQVEAVLRDRFQLEKTQDLSGTWELDNFTLNLYHSSKLKSFVILQ